MCQEMFIHILATPNSGMPTPEICFLPGQLKQRCCTRSAAAIPSMSVNRMHNHPTERRRLPRSYRRPSEIFFANA